MNTKPKQPATPEYFGYLINPYDRSIRLAEYKGWRSIAPMLSGAQPLGSPEIDTFDIAKFSSSHLVYVDDMGLYRKNKHFFTVEGYNGFLAGPGFVRSYTMDGEDHNPSITLDQMQQYVEFYSPSEIPESI